MWRLRELKFYFIFFYLFSQTSYISTQIDRTKQLKICSIVLKIFQLSVLVRLTAAFIHTGNIGLSPKDFDGFALQFLIYLRVICSHYILLYNSFLLSVKSIHICGSIAAIIQYIELKLKNSVQMDKFKNFFQKKLLLAMFIQIIGVTFAFALDGLFKEPFHFSCAQVIACTKIAALFYVIFFIDFMTCLLHSVNKTLREIVRDPNKNKKIFATLFHLKWVHFHLFKFSNLLNERFGMLILLFLMENFTTCYVAFYRSVVIWPSFVIAGKCYILHIILLLDIIDINFIKKCAIRLNLIMR